MTIQSMGFLYFFTFFLDFDRNGITKRPEFIIGTARRPQSEPNLTGLTVMIPIGIFIG